MPDFDWDKARFIVRSAIRRAEAAGAVEAEFLYSDAKFLLVHMEELERRAETRLRRASGEPPPSSFLIALMMPADKSTDVILNLEELFETRWLPKYGRTRATRIWWSQSIQIVVGRWAILLLDVVDRIKHIRIN